jgi:hypothetical protein
MLALRSSTIAGTMILLASAGSAATPGALYSPVRPSIAVEGTAAPDLDERVLGLEIEERADGSFTIEVSLSNWGAGPSGSAGFVLFEDPRIAIGKPITLSLGDDGSAASFDGTITVLRAEMDEGSPPRIELEAVGSRIPASGGPALEILPEGFTGERRLVEGRIAPIVSAEVTSTPILRPGALVTFPGAGPWFPGFFKVRSVEHRFDLDRGLRSRFEAVRPVRQAQP